MRWLIVGANGRLGRALTAAASGRPDLSVTALPKDRLDITSASAVARAMRAYRPDWVLNAAAVTRAPEARDYEYWRVNAEAPGILAAAARNVGARLLHVSTDYVFSGAGETPWCERDRPGAVGLYGRSKEEGERAVLGSGVAGYLVRAGWLHSGERDFVSAVLERAVRGERLRVVTDQIGKPSETRAFARWLVEVLCTYPEPRGMEIEHYVENGPYVSRFEEAQYILTAAKEKAEGENRKAVFASALVKLEGTKNRDPGQPGNCRLVCGKVSGPSEILRATWEEGVDNSVINWLSQSADLWISPRSPAE